MLARVAAECGDALDVAPELDLLCEEGVTSLAVFGALIGEVRFVLCCEFYCGDEDGVVGHSVLLDETRYARVHSNNAGARRSRISAARSSIRPCQHCLYLKVR
jgi:hypothetical protein